MKDITSTNTVEIPHYISKKQLRSMCGNVSAVTIHRWVKAGILPPPRALGNTRVMWLLSEVAPALLNFPVATGRQVAVPSEGKRRGRPRKSDAAMAAGG